MAPAPLPLMPTRLAIGLAVLAPLAHAQAPDVTLTPLDPSAALFGAAVAVVPDLDGDGAADFAVAATNEEVGERNGAGRVYVFSGATGALRYRIEPPDPARTNAFGHALAGVPDADGDGYGDVLIGVPGFQVPDQPDRNTVGRAYLFSGATGVLLHTFDTPNPDYSNAFGTAVAGLGDVNGDGRGDLAVSAPNETFRLNDLSAPGRVYVFSGATGGAIREVVVPEVTVSNPGLGFGKALAAVPDVDGDGVDDLAIGAPGYRAGTEAAQRNNGRAYLISAVTGDALLTLDTPAGEFEGSFGTSVGGVPDADGDGRGDVLVGAPGEDGGGLSNAGHAYLFSGSTGALLHALVSPLPRSGGGFGQTIAGIGDLDGDGRGDVAVGAPSENRNVTSDPGRVHVFSSATGTSVATLRAPDPGDPIPVASFGSSVAGVPDRDGDGRAEVLVGAVEHRVGTSQTGSAFVYRPLGTAVAGGLAPEGSLPTMTAAPVPARGQVTLSYALDRPGPARMAVYDALGREVALVVGGDLPAGRGEATLDVARLAPGVYVARLDAGGASAVARLVVVR